MPESVSCCPRCGTKHGGSTGGLCLGCLLSFGLKGTDEVLEAELRADSQASSKLSPVNEFERYHILNKLGEGGCGIVYRAEQIEPVRREVALKVIKLGMDTPSVVARFETERQALALMDHPGIAAVFDAGSTRSGRPFFVMELVPGEPITRYCERHQLGLEERLRLFAELCLAVQHAHQKGVIHRDIKPSNVLVVETDGVPRPKVIDFGVAKATARQRLADQTIYTAFDQFVGTPAYMSPEQAGLTGEDVDTRTDIYALGVLLYELLTGAPPFDPQRLRDAALDEACRIIRDEEPARPSTRVTAAVTKKTGTAKDSQLVSTWTKRLRGDLDWIVMKALEKQPARRYDSASDFARDIVRHLAHEPVAARPPSRTYLARKFIGKHRVAVSAGAAISLAVVAGLVLALFGFSQAQQERRRAEVEAAAAVTINDFFMNNLMPQFAATGTNLDVTMRDILESASAGMKQQVTGYPGNKRYRTIWKDTEPDPLIEHLVEQLQRKLGPGHPVLLKHEFELITLNGAAANWERCVALAGSIAQQTNFLAFRREALFRGAIAAAMAGDLDSFRLFAGYLASQALSKPHGEWAREAIEIACLMPQEVAELDRLLEMANEELAYITPQHPIFDQVARGFFEYRRGNLAAAWEWLERWRLAAGADLGCQAEFLCAMILHQQGNSAAAMAELQEARRRLAGYVQSGGLATYWDRWHQHARAAITGAEAERLILGRQVTPFVDAVQLAAAREQWTSIRQHLNNGYELAYARKWGEARREFLAVMRERAFDWTAFESVNSRVTQMIAITLLRAGDHPGFLKVCEGWFRRLDKTPHPILVSYALRVALAKSLDATTDLGRLIVRFTNRLESGREEATLVRSMLSLRLGRFQEAIDQSEMLKRSSNVVTLATTHLYRTIALAKLNDMERAHQELMLAKTQLPERREGASEPMWGDLELCALALEEAESVLAEAR